MNKNYFARGCFELVRELTRMIADGIHLDNMDFVRLCEDKKFFDYLKRTRRTELRLEYFYEGNPLFDADNYEFINETFAGNTNAYSETDWGLKESDNALFWAINIIQSTLSWEFFPMPNQIPPPKNWE